MTTAGTAPLRIAIIAGSRVVPAWVAALAKDLQAAATVDVECFVAGWDRHEPVPPLARRLWRHVESRLAPGVPDALRPISVPWEALDEQALPERDAILCFAGVCSKELIRSTRYGVWTVRCGPCSAPAVAGEVPVTLYRTEIDAELPSGRCVALYDSFGAIDPASGHRTRSHAFWKAAGAFGHRLETVRRLGDAFLESCPDATVPRGTQTPDSAVAVTRRAARAAAGIARRRLWNLRRREVWFIAARPHRQEWTADGFFSTNGFRPLGQPSSTHHADPCVFEHEDMTYVFFEEFPPDVPRGRIAYVRLDEEARPVGSAASAVTAPYHLSYPYVFRHGDEIFMLVESSANATVELYRAAAFPSTWARAHVLLDGVRAFDATLHSEDGRLWLFVGMAARGAAPNDELHLYSSESLSGPWTPHARNPVVTDVRRARPAGRIFRKGDSLIRPSQDCSRRYGSSIVFNRIDVLDETRYVETPVTRIDPDWLPGLVATHTYNFGARVEVLDGKWVVRRPLPELLRSRRRSGDAQLPADADE